MSTIHLLVCQVRDEDLDQGQQRRGQKKGSSKKGSVNSIDKSVIKRRGQSIDQKKGSVNSIDIIKEGVTSKKGSVNSIDKSVPVEKLSLVARKLRVQYPGAIYHVMNRGDRREPIFKDDADRHRFLQTLGEACLKTGWQMHAYCLMANHFHLVVETPQANLVAGMKWFLGTYTSRFNRRHKLSGHLFSGRYKSLIVDGSANGYLRTVCDYVHLNPARANLLLPAAPLREYRWSSWPEYLKSPVKRPGWLRVERVLGEYRIPQDSAAGRRALERAMEASRSAEDGKDYKAVRRGWFFGDKALKAELLAAVNAQAGGWHYGEELRESVEAQAERMVAKELKRRQWTAAAALAARRKGDAGKLAIARRLREETTMTLAWIAQRLKMGTKTHFAHLLYWQDHKK